MRKGFLRSAVVAIAPPSAVAVGNVDPAGHMIVAHGAAALRADEQLAADARGVDLAGAVVLDDDRSLDVGRENSARAIGLDGERTGNVSRHHITGAVTNSDVAPNVVDDETARSIRNVNRLGSIHLEVSRSVSGFKRSDVSNLGGTASVGNTGGDACRYLDDQIESGRLVLEEAPVAFRHVGLDVNLISTALSDDPDVAKNA